MLYITRKYHDHDEVIEVGETQDLRISDITADDTVMISRCRECGNLYAWTYDDNVDCETIKCPFCGESYLDSYYERELVLLWYDDDFDDFDEEDDCCEFEELDDIN